MTSLDLISLSCRISNRVSSWRAAECLRCLRKLRSQSGDPSLRRCAARGATDFPSLAAERRAHQWQRHEWHEWHERLRRLWWIDDSAIASNLIALKDTRMCNVFKELIMVCLFIYMYFIALAHSRRVQSRFHLRPLHLDRTLDCYIHISSACNSVPRTLYIFLESQTFISSFP